MKFEIRHLKSGVGFFIFKYLGHLKWQDRCAVRYMGGPNQVTFIHLTLRLCDSAVRPPE